MQDKETSPAQRASNADQTSAASTQPVGERTQAAPPPTPPARSGGLSGGVLRTGATLLLALVLLGVGLFIGTQIGKSGSNTASVPTTQSAAAINALPEQIAATFRQSVVQINVVTDKGDGLGSGTIIDSRGYIVTNYHVISGEKQIQVELYNGTHVSAQLTGIYPPDDLAVIKIQPTPHMAVAKIGDSSQLNVAEYVMAIGNPLGITQTVTSGIVSALGRNIPAGPGVLIADAIQTDAAINPGNSGGALVDLQGELIGVPTLTIVNPTFNSPASGVGFAIPSNRVKFIVPQLIQDGRVTNTGRATLGVNTVSVDAAVATQMNLSINQGALIVTIASNGPAAQAGLQTGDVIVRLGNEAITSSQSLANTLLSANPGTSVAVQVYRGGKQLTINARLSELSATT
jgi:S1-C subfamily serine protease